MFYLMTHGEKFDNETNPGHTPIGAKEIHDMRNLLWLLDLSRPDVDPRAIFAGTGTRHIQMRELLVERYPHLWPDRVYHAGFFGTEVSIYVDRATDESKAALSGDEVIPRKQHLEIRDLFPLRAVRSATRKAAALVRPGDAIVCCGAEFLRAWGWKDKTSARIFKLDPWSKEGVQFIAKSGDELPDN